MVHLCSVDDLRRVGTSDQSTVAATPCTATATQIPTATAGVSGDDSRTLSELYAIMRRVLSDPVTSCHVYMCMQVYRYMLYSCTMQLAL